MFNNITENFATSLLLLGRLGSAYSLNEEREGVEDLRNVLAVL